MIEIDNRVSENPNMFQVKEQPDGKFLITRDDSPIKEGTPINRKTLMAIQGFMSSNTIYENGVYITTTEEGGVNRVTVSENVITSEFTGPSGSKIIKTTTVNSDGSITTVSEEVV